MKPCIELASAGLTAALALAASVWYVAASGAWLTGAEFETALSCIEGVVPPGQEVRVRIVMKNRSAEDVRLVGSSDFCGPGGCISMLGLPVVVRARSEVALEALVKAPVKPREFDLKTTIFTDRPSQQEVAVEVVGRAAEAGPGCNDSGARLPTSPLFSGARHESRAY